MAVFMPEAPKPGKGASSKKPADDVVDYAAPAQAAGIDLEPAWNEWLSLLEQSLKEGFADK